MRRNPIQPKTVTGVRIREIRAAGLRGATPKGGWSNELRPEDVVHTLIPGLALDPDALA